MLDAPAPPSELTVRADPAERLVAPPAPSRAGPRLRFALLLALCLAAHLGLIALLLSRDAPEAERALAEEEIPVEVVTEMPPEIKPEPPPKMAKAPPPVKELVEPPPVKPKPPPQKVELEDVPVAHDAPKAGDSDNTKRGEPDKPSAAPKIAPSAKQDPAKPQEKQTPDEAPPVEKDAAKTPEPEAAPEKLVEDKPDAEPLDKAQPKPQDKPKEKKAPAPAKAPPGQGQTKSVADQLAALSPAPNYSLGATAKSAPISGGTDKVSYESVLMGLIKRRYQPPPPAAGHPIMTGGMIGFYIDENGNLTHQVIYRASGLPAVDAAWLNAIRRAAPFPPPPRGIPHNLYFTYPSSGS